jgi:endonuclease-3
MQTELAFGQTADLKTIKVRLRSAFGPEPEGVRLRPIDQFIRGFIGSRTYDWQSNRAFTRILNRFTGPEEMADAPVAEIARLLEGVTHGDDKAKNLQGALREIRAASGALDLEFLGGLEVGPALQWLEQIHGVGRKIAAATLNFSSLRKRAFVVDTHIIRVMRRFGFVRSHATTQDVYDAVMAAADRFSATDLYELHWHLKKLGQNTCEHARAACTACPLSDFCMKRIESDSALRGRAA